MAYGLRCYICIKYALSLKAQFTFYWRLSGDTFVDDAMAQRRGLVGKTSIYATDVDATQAGHTRASWQSTKTETHDTLRVDAPAATGAC